MNPSDTRRQGSVIALARWQLIVMAGIVLLFLASTLPGALGSRDTESDVDALIGNALPSVQLISAARGDLNRLDSSLERYVRARTPADRASPETLDTYRQNVDAAIAAYLAFPFFPGEQSLFDDVTGPKA
ncbi:MAG: Tar ligand binding domain-containing protein, partial [Polyangiaceae bacterium]